MIFQNSFEKNNIVAKEIEIKIAKKSGHLQVTKVLMKKYCAMTCTMAFSTSTTHAL
jgi:hypothetical protein